jgi:predicted nucleic acid-binding Zn ribbon protein
VDRIGKPLKDLLHRLGLETPMEGWAAVSLWDDVVGERVAAHSHAVSYRDGTLVVEVDSASWMSELSYLKRRVAAELNRRLGKDLVQDIRLLPGSRGPQTVRRRPEGT